MQENAADEGNKAIDSLNQLTPTPKLKSKGCFGPYVREFNHCDINPTECDPQETTSSTQKV